MPHVSRRLFRAMGCESAVIVVADTAAHAAMLAADAEARIAWLEARWSRFVPTSDVSRINANSGTWVHVDGSTLDLVWSMVCGWRATDGAFDPTLLAPLVGLGAGASWHDPTAVTSLAEGTLWRGDPAAVDIDRTAGAVRVPRGTALDAGGIGKGAAADLVVAELLSDGARGALVSLGGDVRVDGESPDGGPWVLTVSDGLAEVARVRLGRGGVATSGVMHRTWISPAGERVHHLLDPVSGRPVEASQLRAVTVVAGDAMWAEVLTKVVFVRGGLAALPWLDELGVAALTVDADGLIRANAAWNSFAEHGVAA